MKSTLQAAEQSVKKAKQEIDENIKTVINQGEHLKELIDTGIAETVSDLEGVKTKITQQFKSWINLR